MKARAAPIRTHLVAAMPLVLAMLLAPWGVAHAVRAADTPPPAPEAVRAANGPAGSSKQAAPGLVTMLDAAAGRIEIDRVAYLIVPGRTQVYRAGRPVDLSGWVAQAQGQRVHFTVSPGGSGVQVLGVVHAP